MLLAVELLGNLLSKDDVGVNAVRNLAQILTVSPIHLRS